MRLLRERPKRTPRHPSSLPSPWAAALPYTVALVIVLLMAFGLREEAARLKKQEEGVMTVHTMAVSGRTERQATEQQAIQKEIVIDLSVLEEFQDHTPDIPEEPFRYLVRLCSELEPEDLEPYARPDFTYRDLFEKSHDFRGQVLRFRGRVRRVREVPAPVGADYGVDRYYECWVFTSEAGRLPYCVISVHPPDGIPVAERINLPCEVTGIYLGWWKHETAERKLLSSPIVVTPRIRRVELKIEPMDGLGHWVGAGIALLILAGLAVVLWLSRQRREEPTLLLESTESTEEGDTDEGSP